MDRSGCSGIHLRLGNKDIVSISIFRGLILSFLVLSSTYQISSDSMGNFEDAIRFDEINIWRLLEF